ncbi:hypothetical protein [Thalassomonas sp. RHCl1]|uniref:hypothetical protein n=1 Tax=Thalassomonas sp. RHCl1 TaxID=2995320 RepID=UPI00248B4E8B|nr:hypothetical protein [Thalassomonas sp. RHCl1]
MSNESIIYIAAMFCAVAFLGIFIWVCFAFYLKSKWLPYVENILDGHRFYSLNIFLAGHGILSYAIVFCSKWHAHRMRMLEKRDQVPKKVQRLFIFSFYFFMASVALFIGSVGVIYLLRKMEA